MAQQTAAEVPGDNLDDIVDELAPGTKLLRGQYTIVRYLNSGGFGITYLAKDSLDRNVVIKECFPSSYCRRSKTVVAARSRAHTAELRSVVQQFVREARNLAKIVHPNIVAVHQVFEDNFTAYMAIDFIDGLDLQEVIEGKGQKHSPQEIVSITEKLIGAVGFIHDHDMLHRDISPDNVLIDKSGEPILIDFGAARDEASTKNRAMSALRVVKDGYSPQEFYIAGSDQGPWSDLYALGATLYHLISGDAPTNGQARLAALAEGRPDPYLPLDGRFPGYPLGFLKAIDKAMNTLPAQRVQSAREWLALFHSNASFGTGMQSAVRALVAEPVSGPAPAARARVHEAPMLAGHDLSDHETADLSGTSGFAGASDYGSAHPAAASGATPSGKSGVPMIAVGVLLLVAALGGGYFMMGGKDDPTPAPETAATTTPEPATETKTATTETTVAGSASAETAGTEAVATETAASETDETTPSTGDTASASSAATIAATPDPVPEAVEVAPAETSSAASTEPAEETVAIAAPTGILSANQIVFAAWDAQVPFTVENRIVGNTPVAIVARIPPTIDLSVVGDWLKPGLLLYSVNGKDIQDSGGLTTALLNAMRVDPDGKARLVIEYAGSSLERHSGLLTVDTTRLISLANGVSLQGKVIDGKWQTEVTGVTLIKNTDLIQGDILFREKTTGIAIDSAETLESVIAQLVEAGTGLAVFSIIRDNKIVTASMQLAVEP